MRILALDFEPASNRGGQEKSLFDILIGLRSRGHEVVLAYVKAGDLLGKYREHEVSLVQIERISIVNKASIREIGEFTRSVWALRGVRGDVFYINQIADAPLAVALHLTGGIPRIVCHLRLPPLVDCVQVRLSIPFVDRFIVANEFMKRIHVKQGHVPAARIEVIPNGFWMNGVPPRHSKKGAGLRIAFLARFHPAKGLEFLLRALGLVRQRQIPFALDIGGAPISDVERAFQTEMEKLASGLGIGESVRWIGFVADPIEHLARYDLTVFPSQWDEPFGRVMVESILAGTPVIASDRGSAREILSDPEGEWLFASIEKLADLIVRFSRDRNAYPIKDKTAYVLEQFDLGKILPRLENVLLG